MSNALTRLFLLIAIAAAAISPDGAFATEIDQQRALFKHVYKDVERGNWRTVDELKLAEKRLLSAYVLWPDLRAAYFRATLATADHGEVELFLSRYGVLQPARDLRYRYALHLANAGHQSDFLQIYQQFYQGLQIAKLDCLAVDAEIATGREQRAVERATELWMVGYSQADECDPVFAFLNTEGLLGTVEYTSRFNLAIDARQFNRARWLARSIDQSHTDIANRWLEAQASPGMFVQKHLSQTDIDATVRRQLIYAIERVTYEDPARAHQLWSALRAQHDFSAGQQADVARHIALWTARDRLQGAYALLTALPQGALTTEVLRWRARTSLRNHNWSELLIDIDSMPDDERNSEEWQYWRAVALRHLDQPQLAVEVLQSLAPERSYYGFLAADALHTDYALDDSQAGADEAVISRLAGRQAFVRARELFNVGLDSRGRSEWDAALGELPPEETIQAAILADRWGWHSRAISTAASAGHFDDLALRYPLPYRQTFAQFSSSAKIDPTWAYGVARSESLFMRDIRSSAGAIGLMQLMPATGRRVARSLNVPFSGLDTLTDPEDNIRLGTTYLGQMAERFGGNRVLATAAYNAGPHRVEAWLPESGHIDARIWIESIPFNETRKYVRRVMTAETIFRWRMTGQLQRLSDRLEPVEAAQTGSQLVQN